MTKLTLLVHGRSASTLMLRMLYETNQFKLWGTPPTGECTPFRNKPHTWNKATIIKEWKKIYTPGDHILAKLPAFAFFIEEMLILEPDIIVLERPIIDIVRSYISVGWVNAVMRKHAEWGVMERAAYAYRELGGQLTENPLHRIAVVYGWSHHHTHRMLEHYPRKLFIHYRDLISDSETIFTRLENFLEIQGYKETWSKIMKTRHQATGRPLNADYRIPLKPALSDTSLRSIHDATQRFGCL